MLKLPRLASLVAFAAIGVSAVFSAVDIRAAGYPRATLRPASPDSNDTFVVQAAPPGDELRAGDEIRLLDRVQIVRLQFQTLRTGSTLDVLRIAPGPPMRFQEPVVKREDARGFFGWTVLVLQLAFLAVAALVVTRGGAGGSLQLGWLLALIVLDVNPTAPAWPGPLIVAFDVLGGALVAVAFWAAADFASRFTGQANALWARRTRRIAAAFALVTGLVIFGVSLDALVSATTPSVLQYLQFPLVVAQALIFLLGLWLAYANAPPFERQKALWVAASLGGGIVGGFVGGALGVLGVAEPWRDVPFLFLIAMPVGCAYAILRYRLLDIGFVVNRAAVFGATSLIVLGALALIDFGLQNWLGAWLVRTGLVVQLVLALGIGIATRPLHNWVDHFVDDLFFRKRHEAEAALRAFARDVAYIDDAGVVIERTVETIGRHAELSASLFLLSDAGYAWQRSSAAPPPRGLAGRNDGAVVRMLATRAYVDLRETDSGLEGDYAFPMFARGRLTGFLTCGEKLDGVAAYAPDELATLAATVAAVALSLDLLRVEELENQLAALRHDSASRAGIMST